MAPEIAEIDGSDKTGKQIRLGEVLLCEERDKGIKRDRYADSTDKPDTPASMIEREPRAGAQWNDQSRIGGIVIKIAPLPEMIWHRVAGFSGEILPQKYPHTQYDKNQTDACGK